MAVSKGKIITARQQEIVSNCISGLVLLLYSSNHQWNRQQRRDIEAAYAAIGVKPPFSFENSPDEPVPPPTRVQRVRAWLNRPLFKGKPAVEQQPEPVVLR